MAISPFASGAQMAGASPALSQSTQPATQPQVHQMLDSGNFALDSLEQTVSVLIQRLIEVSTFTKPDEDGSTAPQPILVPVASRISYITSRIRDLDNRLLTALNALEV